MTLIHISIDTILKPYVTQFKLQKTSYCDARVLNFKSLCIVGFVTYMSHERNQMYDFQKIVGMSGSFECKDNRRINTYFERLVRYALHKSYCV